MGLPKDRTDVPPLPQRLTCPPQTSTRWSTCCTRKCYSMRIRPYLFCYTFVPVDFWLSIHVYYFSYVLLRCLSIRCMVAFLFPCDLFSPISCYDECSSPKEALFTYLISLSHHPSLTFYNVPWSMLIVGQYTVTPKTFSMFASNAVCEVWHNQGWESRFTLVELKMVSTPGYKLVPGSCDVAQWLWRYGQFEMPIPLKGFFHFWIEARISVKEMDNGYCVTVQTKIHK